jgi:hypothetical protein
MASCFFEFSPPSDQTRARAWLEVRFNNSDTEPTFGASSWRFSSQAGPLQARSRCSTSFLASPVESFLAVAKS